MAKTAVVVRYFGGVGSMARRALIPQTAGARYLKFSLPEKTGVKNGDDGGRCAEAL